MSTSYIDKYVLLTFLILVYLLGVMIGIPEYVKVRSTEANK